MLPIRRWLDRLTDRRPAIRASRHSFRKPWWRRDPRVWLLLGLALLLAGVISLLLARASAASVVTPYAEPPDSAFTSTLPATASIYSAGMPTGTARAFFWTVFARSATHRWS